MSKVEELLEKIKGNVTKLDLQIESLLKGLLQDNLLEESPLTPMLVKNRPSEAKETKSLDTLSISSSTTKKPGSSGLLTSNSKKRNVPIDELTESLPKKMNLEPGFDKTKVNSVAKKSVFASIDSESFFVPVMDKWVFRTTLINSSKVAQKLPDINLSFVNQNGSSIGQPFTYCYKALLVNVDKDFYFLDDPKILPVQEALVTEADLDPRILGTQDVKPGSKFAASVCFSQPMLSSLNLKEGLSILVSLTSDEKIVWSKSIPFDSKALDFSANDAVLAKFSEQIFIVMSQFRQNFKLECLANPCLDLLPSFHNFITNNLKLSQIETVSTRFDTSVKSYYTRHLTFFWGFVLELECCERNENLLRGTVFTRTPEQLYMFYQLLFRWVQEQKDKNQTILVSHELSKKEAAIPELFRKEIKTVIHFMYLDHRRMIDEGNDAIAEQLQLRGGYATNIDLVRPNKTRVALNWLRTYINDMISTDSMFMFDNDSL